MGVKIIRRDSVRKLSLRRLGITPPSDCPVIVGFDWLDHWPCGGKRPRYRLL